MLKQKLLHLLSLCKKAITFDFTVKQPYRTHLFYILLILNIVMYHQLYEWYRDYQNGGTNILSINREAVRPVQQAMASERSYSKTLSREEWIRQEVEFAGLNYDEFACVIKGESGWNDWAINKNTNGTFDTGIMQWNQIHNLPRWFTFDYKLSVLMAIKKRQADGNYNAWYGYKNNNCQRFK